MLLAFLLRSYQSCTEAPTRDSLVQMFLRCCPCFCMLNKEKNLSFFLSSTVFQLERNWNAFYKFRIELLGSRS